MARDHTADEVAEGRTPGPPSSAHPASAATGTPPRQANLLFVLDGIEKEFPVHGGQMSQGEGKDGFGSTDEIESECHFYHILI